MANRDKRPRMGAKPPAAQPRLAANPEDIGRRTPVWRVNLMDLEGPFGWKRASAQDLQQIFDRLKSFETMTWQDVDQTKSCGIMPVGQMSKDAQGRLTETGRDEYDALYKLRINQKGRLWGVRMEHVLHLLWWDPEHLVYPMNIKDN